MSARRIPFACATVAALAAPTVAGAATTKQAPPPGARIAAGVSAGGVDLGGLTVPEAAGRLHNALDPHLARPVALDVGGRTYRLTMAAAKFTFDADATAKAALAAVPPPATATPAGGAAMGKVIPLVVHHSTAAVQAFVSKTAGAARRTARSATLKITLEHMVVRRSKYGYRLDQLKAYKAVNAALNDAAASRKVHLALNKIRPAVNTNDLAEQYPTVITIDKAERKLRLFKNLKISKRYGVAIGQPAYPTPEGRFKIQDKQVNPVWSVPNSPWAGELAGTTVTGGSAANPLKARWMGIVGGVGIHGTGDDASIGTAASHGCLRMHVSDVIDLFPRVPVGTPVLIG
jgi:lipoprotein-anchoring transpeptidase ErfK/SrfK